MFIKVFSVRIWHSLSPNFFSSNILNIDNILFPTVNVCGQKNCYSRPYKLDNYCNLQSKLICMLTLAQVTPVFFFHAFQSAKTLNCIFIEMTWAILSEKQIYLMLFIVSYKNWKIILQMNSMLSCTRERISTQQNIFMSVKFLLMTAYRR